MAKNIWIGQVHGRRNSNIGQNQSLSEKIIGCYVNAVANCSSIDEFKEVVSNDLANEGFDVIEYFDINDIKSYKKYKRISGNIRRALGELEFGHEVSYSDFHLYENDDA